MIKPNLRPKLGSSALIAFLSLYSSLVLNYAFFAKVVELRPFNDTGADIFLYTMPVVLFFLSNFVFHVIA
ncbi:TPA: phosphoethanolamine transferase, partial [Neisseria gonorrhoeae]